MLKLFFHGLPFPENCQSNYCTLVFLRPLVLENCYSVLQDTRRFIYLLKASSTYSRQHFGFLIHLGRVLVNVNLNRVSLLFPAPSTHAM